MAIENDYSNSDIRPRVQQIVREYRTSRDLSIRAFAEQLSEATTKFGPFGFRISHAAVANWEKGVAVPDFRELARLAVFSVDWRSDFAVDVLAALMPHVYQPEGEIGKRILAASD